jgi:mannose-1-phosphate guanylyltransferase
MHEHFYAVIMAGGGGTRLWPLSRQQHPKQMLALSGKRTLFQLSLDRLKGLFPLERILIMTTMEQAGDYLKQYPGLTLKNFLLEPSPRGTASVIAWAAKELAGRDPESTMAVLTADHLISNMTAFKKVIRLAYKVAQAHDLVTLGIKPTHPHTGYGYIHFKEALGTYGGLFAFRVKQFKEKPDEKKAHQFVRSGDHAWNSGMFIWQTKTILEEFQRWMPDLLRKITEFHSLGNAPSKTKQRISVWSQIEPQTIDFGIMEKSRRIAMILADDLGWNDVGSWESIFDVYPADENGNIVLNGKMELLDSHGSLIDCTNPDKLVAIIGLNDFIIIDTQDALLVCPRNDSQKVRDLVNVLKKKKLTRYL